MGRNIRIQFQGGGEHAVFLMDGRAQDDYSGWDINTPAFEWFLNPACRRSCRWAGSPASTPTGTSRRRATVRTTPTSGKRSEPGAAGLPQGPEGHQPERQCGGWSVDGRQHCADLRDLLPAEVRLRVLAVGLLNPSEGWWPMLIGLAMNDAGGFNAQSMWAPRRTRRGGAMTRWSTSTSSSPTTPESGSTAVRVRRRIWTPPAVAAT